MMKETSDYLKFLKEKGRPLNPSYSESLEIALNIEECLTAIDILNRADVLILGGEILTENNGQLIYAIHKWGYEYSYLNWSVDRKEVNESVKTYISESHRKARECILAANEVADRLKNKCFVVLVTELG
ncbi:hypothetical protein [Dyadobacter sp. CY323]|uniref:hypothetical protein n=1 Tax=Dyadobacter sp. CY323 TaxID=2907302 RepID=UPI001F44507D|nr:hypothetical protein [Dyadobacter sp. CY323]MCE6988168.1 hypothetical protein [Dyadobacter sp. CY323]